MSFLKSKYLKHQAKKIISTAILSENGLENAPGEMVSDISVIENLSDGLVELIRKNLPEGKEERAIIEGVSEALIHLSVPSEDREIILKHAENLLDGNFKGDFILEQLRPNPQTPKEYVVINTLNFTHASTLMIDDEKLNKTIPKAGSCVYFFGSACYLAKKCNLKGEEFSSAIIEIMMDYGMNQDEATTFFNSMQELLDDPVGKEAFREGFDAIKAFAEENDNSAGLRLRRLVDKWAEF